MQHPAALGRKTMAILWHPATWLITMTVGYFAGVATAGITNNFWAFVGGVIWAVLLFVPTVITIRGRMR